MAKDYFLFKKIGKQKTRRALNFGLIFDVDRPIDR